MNKFIFLLVSLLLCGYILDIHACQHEEFPTSSDFRAATRTLVGGSCKMSPEGRRQVRCWRKRVAQQRAEENKGYCSDATSDGDN